MCALTRRICIQKIADTHTHSTLQRSRECTVCDHHVHFEKIYHFVVHSLDNVEIASERLYRIIDFNEIWGVVSKSAASYVSCWILSLLQLSLIGNFSHRRLIFCLWNVWEAVIWPLDHLNAFHPIHPANSGVHDDGNVTACGKADDCDNDDDANDDDNDNNSDDD